MAGALGQRHRPASVHQCLEVAADRRLWQLQDRAELRDRQLVPIPAAAGRGTASGPRALKAAEKMLGISPFNQLLHPD